MLLQGRFTNEYHSYNEYAGNFHSYELVPSNAQALKPDVSLNGYPIGKTRKRRRELLIQAPEPYQKRKQTNLYQLKYVPDQLKQAIQANGKIEFKSEYTKKPSIIEEQPKPGSMAYYRLIEEKKKEFQQHQELLSNMRKSKSFFKPKSFVVKDRLKSATTTQQRQRGMYSRSSNPYEHSDLESSFISQKKSMQRKPLLNKASTNRNFNKSASKYSTDEVCFDELYQQPSCKSILRSQSAVQRNRNNGSKQTTITNHSDSVATLSHMKRERVVDFDQHQERQQDYLIKHTEAYKNIQRDNQKLDYLKRVCYSKKRAGKSQSNRQDQRYESIQTITQPNENTTLEQHTKTQFESAKK